MNTKVTVKLAHIAFWFFLSTGETCGTDTDVYCLRSVKDSLQDPLGYLDSTWDFSSNRTEGFICKFERIACWHPDENKVLAIELSEISLKGEFPKGLQNCTSVITLDLSSNQLSGTLPSDICQMLPYLTFLDLSSNNFTGEIPLGLSECKFLNFLKLDYNRLTGQIPTGIGRLERLKKFSVTNNLLSGQVPTFVGKLFPAENYANNTGLCGAPLVACKAAYKGKSHTAIMIGSGVVGGILTTLLGACIFPEKHKKEPSTETNALRA